MSAYLDSANNRFSLIEEDVETEKMANLGLVQLLAHAPSGSVAFGEVEKSGGIFVARLEIRSPYQSFVARAGGITEKLAVKRVIHKVDEQVFKWRTNKPPYDELEFAKGA
jgi:hypothetical protein